MTATYVSPSTSDKDAVRFLLGDTVVASPILQDEEIDYLVSRWKPLYNTVEYVASVAADVISARYAREANFSADGVSVSLANLGQQFRDLAASLRSQHKSLLVGGQPDAGGITPGEEDDPSVTPTSFGTQQHDNPEAGRQDYGHRDITSPYYVAEYQPGA